MLRRLDDRLPLPIVVALFPIAFLLHDGEEVLTIAPWMATNHAAAVLTLLVAILVATCLMLRAIRRGRVDWTASPFLVIAAIFALNIFTHLGQSLLLGGYTPGVATAILVMIPYAAYLYRRLFQAGILTPRRLLLSLAGGALLGMPVVMVALEIGRRLAV